MISDPKNILFESTNDLVDYVSKGLPPSKKQYGQFRIALNSPVDDPEIYARQTVAVSRDIVSSFTQEDMYAVFDRVYENQRKNYAIAIVVGVAAAAICGVAGFALGCSKTDEKWADKLDGCSLNF